MHTSFEYVCAAYVFKQRMNASSAHGGDGLVAQSPLGHVASLQTPERRILALEAPLAEVEGGYGDPLYKLHRNSVKADLRVSKILGRLDIPDVSDNEVDAAWTRPEPPPEAGRTGWLGQIEKWWTRADLRSSTHCCVGLV